MQANWKLQTTRTWPEVHKQWMDFIGPQTISY